MSGNEDEQDETIRVATENEQLKELLKRMNEQMADLSTKFDTEKKERERLSFLFDAQTQSGSSSTGSLKKKIATNPSAEVPSSQHLVTDNSSFEPPLNPNAPVFEGSQIGDSLPQNQRYFNVAKKIYDLTPFDGNPEKWPSWSATYRESTQNMQYSNWQNHGRLEKSLHGKAEAAVSGLMIHSDNVELVMEELERQFGQPEHLLKCQMDKIKLILPVPEHRLDLLIPLATKVRNLAAFLDSLGSEPYLTNPTLIRDLSNKLPLSKRLDWGLHSTKIKPWVTIRDFSDWLSDLAHIISLMNVSEDCQPATQQVAKKKPNHRGVHHTTTPVNVPRCILCKGSHKLVDCCDFKKNSVADRWEIVKKHRVCFSCLRFGHQTHACRSKRSCEVNGCKDVHNILLHEEKRSPVDPEHKSAKNPDPESNEKERERCMHAVDKVDAAEKSVEVADVWFKIIPVNLHQSGRTVSTFAMIDEGASVTLVDDRILEKLQLKGTTSNLTLQWFGNKTTTSSSQTVDLEISGIHKDADRFQLKNVRSVKEINLPTQSVKIDCLPRNQRMLKRLPVCEYKNAKPMILIGLDNNFVGAPIETFASDAVNSPVAVKTRLGWIVYGPVYADEQVPRNHHFHLTTRCDDDLNRIMEDYFTVESFGVKVAANVEADSDIHANHLLKTTTVKLEDRYQSGLLWKDSQISLPNNYDMAKKRLIAIENKMRRDPLYKAAYVEAMNNCIIKGYARKLTQEEAAIKTERTWYLPHFLTSNVNKPGKWRLVFDAAAQFQGVSLNDCLLKGPDFYVPLMNVLFNFRVRQIAVTADVKEMFNQVVIQPEDRHSQQFLWRNGDQTSAIGIYVMDRMTFGVTCSPATAHFVKNSNAMQFEKSHPEAVKSIVQHHYVDDFVDSFDDVDTAKTISSTVKDIHKCAGFHLRGFLSNNQEVKDFLNGTEAGENVKQMNMDATTTEKILGMYWDTVDDTFKFVLKFNRVNRDVINNQRRPTKRELLSIVMSVFDPYGFLANFTIYAKIIMQYLWRLDVDWDQPIPDQINLMWTNWWKELEKVKCFKIQRNYFSGMYTNAEIQLHTFVDASQDAFSAVTYLRFYDGQNVTVRLVAGKTRCSPIKKLLSIPRLELQSAVLGVRLCSSIMEGHDFNINQRYFWSDSATVVNWIKSDHRRYKPFVAHRISEILESTKISEWQWISTKLNAADEATRAKFPIKYDPNGQWKNGPAFLVEPPAKWPVAEVAPIVSSDEELKPKFVNATNQVAALINFNRFSNYLRLKRTVGWICRFLHNKFNKAKKSGELDVSELERAEFIICRAVQKEVYNQEVFDLNVNKKLNKRSHIIKLSPMLDNENILRVNGRIRRCNAVSVETKNPIILPKSHHVTKLIVKYHHNIVKHQNNHTVVAEVQQRFWVPDLKSMVKRIRKDCFICNFKSAKPQPPMMGELPVDRVTAFVRPFTFTGVDYFGPYQVTIGRRKEKRWVSLFTCMSTRAIHLEVAADLSTDSCLICIRNFVNRRGKPIRFRSDNGTNFVGCTKELKDAIGAIDNEKIKAELAIQNIDWKFNCPENPHAGGVWERLVKAVKDVLHYTLKEEAPRLEVFNSVMIEAECLVNSRPLTEVPLSHEDDEPITPNHFLIGTANSTQTTVAEEDQKLWCLKKQWRIAQELRNRFWRKWVREYLPTILVRSKWVSKVEPLKIGDLVMICDGDLSSRKLCRGRIIEVYTGADGQVRSAKVKTSTGDFKRPATKLAVLNVDGESSSLDSDQPERFTGGGVVSSNTVAKN